MAPLTRRIDATGWGSMALGLLCVGAAFFDLALPPILARVGSALGAADDPLAPLRESLAHGAALNAAVNGAFGATLMVVGFAVTRRRPWSHRALEITCWASIPALAVSVGPALAPLGTIAGDAPGTAAVMRWTSIGLVILQVAAVLWFLRFWRSPAVVESFR